MKKQIKRRIETATANAKIALTTTETLKKDFDEYKRQVALKGKLIKIGWGLILFVASLSSDFICKVLRGTRWFSFTYHKGFGWVTILTLFSGIILILWGVWKIERFYKSK